MQLLEAHRRGDPAALGELLRGYQRRIYAVCHRMLGDREAAGDLTQDALVRIMEGLSSYDGRSALSTWIIRVTMNCCLSHLRRERLRRHGSLDEPAAGGDAAWVAMLAARRELPAGDRVEQAEMRTLLLRGLAGLEPSMRAVLVLRDLQGLDYRQIGEVLGIAVGTVKSRLFRARAALREAVEEALDPDRAAPADDP